MRVRNRPENKPTFPPLGGTEERGWRECGLCVDHDDVGGERRPAGVRGRGSGGAVGRLQAVREDDGVALVGGPGALFCDVMSFIVF